MAWSDRPLHGPKISERLEHLGGRSAGFDYLRLVLALLILTIHSIKQIHGTVFAPDGAGKYATALPSLLVPMFFALSGFLVSASLERNPSLRTFLGLRALRIFPALWIDVLTAALILGPLMTTLPLGEYFHAPQFHRYFLNLVGEVQYFLPGVFEKNPKHDVNAQLWTIPFELISYMLLSLFALVGIFRRPRLVLVITIFIMLGVSESSYFLKSGNPDFDLGTVPCFLAGTVLFLYRKHVRLNAHIFGMSVVVALAISLTGRSGLACFPVAYMTVFLGLKNPSRRWPITMGDYSYGIFLYHRQIQQTLWATTAAGKTLFGNLSLSLLLVASVAFFSWHLVEKPALRLRKYLHAQMRSRPALNDECVGEVTN